MQEYKSFYKQVGGNEGNLCHYSTRLDTYGCGCQHDCGYCYAKSLLEFRGLWNTREPAVADIEKIKKKLDKIEGIIRMGGMTDCFQPVEKKYGVTYETIKAMNERGIGYLIVTKSTLVADDKYMDIYDKDLAHIQVTITTTDDAKARTYEMASPVSERIKAIEMLQERGFDVSIRLSPFIPGNVDIGAVNKIQCDKILVEFLRCNGFIRKTFPIDYSEYTLKHGGYWHLPLERKIEYLSGIKKDQISVCDDVPEHYEYFKQNFNYNPDDCCNLRREA
jgi:DNA repair photolyase